MNLIKRLRNRNQRPREDINFRPLFLCSCVLMIFEIIMWSQNCKDAYGNAGKTTKFDVDYRREIAAKLLDIAADIKEYERKIYPRTILKLNAVVEMLDPRQGTSNSVKYKFSTDKRKLAIEIDTDDVCGEVYSHPRLQFPFYHKNHPPLCKNGELKKPINELVTIVIYYSENNLTLKKLDDLLESIREYDKKVQVIVAMQSKNNYASNLGNKYGHLTIINNNSPNSGKTWNSLIKEVNTPYVLIARDMSYFHSFARLERQIYAISMANSVSIAGGAFRNKSGHWSAGCFQIDINKYNLLFTEGYRYSAHGCMYCDYLDGPFVARTAMMKDVEMKEDLSDEVLFAHWFVQLRQSNILAMSCPDAMYFTEGSGMLNKKRDRTQWLSVAKDWDLNTINIPPNIRLEFSCQELELECRYLKWDSYYLVPPCCFTQLTQAWEKLQEFTDIHDIDYEIQYGTLLGAVKLRGQLPWDPDADVYYDGRHNATFLRMQHYDNISLREFDPLDVDGPKFKIYTPDYYIEMWGRHKLTNKFLPARFRKTPTLVKVQGLWLKGVANPGLYARNYFGFDYLKHAQHSMSGGFDDKLDLYDAGKWQPCPTKHYHSCLDRYPTDGNIDFVQGEFVWKHSG